MTSKYAVMLAPVHWPPKQYTGTGHTMLLSRGGGYIQFVSW